MFIDAIYQLKISYYFSVSENERNEFKEKENLFTEKLAGFYDKLFKINTNKFQIKCKYAFRYYLID